MDGEDALYGWFGSLGNLHCVVEDVFLPSRLRWVGSYNKEFRGNIPVLVGLWCGGLGKAGVWGIHWKESSWHELRRSSGWAALVGFKPCLYLVLQWGFEIQVEIGSSCSILSSLKAWRLSVNYPTEIIWYQLRFSRVFLGYQGGQLLKTPPFLCIIFELEMLNLYYKSLLLLFFWTLADTESICPDLYFPSRLFSRTTSILYNNKTSS